MYDDVMYTVDPQHIEGEMTIGAKQKSTLGEPEFNTLDEPIRDTIVSVYIVIYFYFNLKIYFMYRTIYLFIRCS